MKYCFPLFLFAVLTVSIGCQNTPVRDQVPTQVPTPLVTHTPTPTLTPIPPTSVPTVTPTPSINKALVQQKFLEGSTYMKKGRYDEAVDSLWEAHNMKPDSALICSSLGDALLHSGLLLQAEKVAARSVELDPAHLEGYRILAQCYIELDEDEKAAAQYQILLEHEPNSLDYLTQLANINIRIQHYAQAIPLFRRIIKMAPPQIEFYQMNLALLLFNLERYEEALTEYKRLTAAMSESFEAHLQLGTIYQKLGQEDNAIDSYLRAFNNIHSPLDELIVRRKLAAVYETRGAKKEALFQYQKIKELSPNDPEIQKKLVTLYQDQNQEKNAVKEINELIQLYPDDISLLELRFSVLSHFHQEKQAYQQYIDALSKWITEENHTAIDHLLGIIMQDPYLKKMEEYRQTDSLLALLHQCESMTDIPDRIHFALIYFYEWKQDKKLVQTHQQHVIQSVLQANQHRDIHTIEIVCFELLNWNIVRNTFQGKLTYSTLFSALQSSASIFPSLYQPHQVLGTMAADQQDFHTAQSQFNQALSRLEPGTDEHKAVLFQMVWSYDRLDRYADMEQLLEEALQIYPDEELVYNSLGYMYANRDIHLEKALLLIEKALMLAPNDANIMDSMGWVYYRLERYQDALHILKKAIAIEAHHPVISMHIGYVYDRLGDTKSALPYWETALEHLDDYPGEITLDEIQWMKAKILQAKE